MGLPLVITLLHAPTSRLMNKSIAKRKMLPHSQKKNRGVEIERMRDAIGAPGFSYV